jgi:hypothetical protein
VIVVYSLAPPRFEAFSIAWGAIARSWLASYIHALNNKGRLVPEPGVTRELRTRASANVAEESKQRRLVTIVVSLAVVAVCAYLVLRWLA